MFCPLLLLAMAGLALGVLGVPDDLEDQHKVEQQTCV
jgi:hypothetical protein